MEEIAVTLYQKRLLRDSLSSTQHGWKQQPHVWEEDDRFYGCRKYKAFIERNHDIRARTARENAKNRVLTDETHRKMSEAALRRIAIHGHPRTGYKMTEEERILHGERMKGLCAGAKNPNARKVALLNTGEIFDYIKEAAAKTGANQFSITECCTGKNKSAGDKDGMRLVWAYYEDYIKMSEDEIRQRIDNAQQPTFGAKNCNARPIICLIQMSALNVFQMRAGNIIWMRVVLLSAVRERCLIRERSCHRGETTLVICSLSGTQQ